MKPVRYLLVLIVALGLGLRWGGLGIAAGFVAGGVVLAWLSSRERRRVRARRRELERYLVAPRQMSATVPPLPPRPSKPHSGPSAGNGGVVISPPPVVSMIPSGVGASARPPTIVTAIRPPQPRKLQWVPPGEVVVAAGRTLNGMVYVSAAALGWDGEPSAICLSQPVGLSDPAEDLPYSPCYEAISPGQRAFYLDWLARGRRDADPGLMRTGYLFLFFYGIERRVLRDGDRDPALWNEVLDLLIEYGMTLRSRSVASYFGDFLHYAAYAMGPERYATAAPALFEAMGESLSETATTFALANAFRMGRPLDWKLARLVAMNLDDSRRSVVTRRAGDAFGDMFRNRYTETFGEGLALKASKRDQRVEYRHGNRALAQGSYPKVPRSEGIWPPGPVQMVPGVMGIPTQFRKLALIWNQCIEDLSGYSRAVSRLAAAKNVTNRDLLDAHLALPEAIRRERDHPLADEFGQLLEACPESGGFRLVPVSALAGLLGIAERANLTAGQCDDVTAMVESLGHALAPHPKLFNLPLGWTQELALVPLESPPPDPVKLGGRLRLLVLAVLVASADGEIDETELEVFRRAGAVEDGFSRTQLAATEVALLRDTRVASRLLSRIAKSVPPAERSGVFRLLVHIAACDGVVSSDENLLLRKVARTFDLGDAALDDVLSDDSAFQTVTVAKGRAGAAGEAIPAPPGGRSDRTFSLDMDRIAALTKETAEVVSILARALAEEPRDEGTEESVPVAAPARPAAIFPVWVATLDPRYQPALMDILALPESGPVDFGAIARTHHLVGDDLVDGLNAWSDENLGDFLIEDGSSGLSLRRDLIPIH